MRRCLRSNLTPSRDMLIVKLAGARKIGRTGERV